MVKDIEYNCLGRKNETSNKFSSKYEDFIVDKETDKGYDDNWWRKKNFNKGSLCKYCWEYSCYGYWVNHFLWLI